MQQAQMQNTATASGQNTTAAAAAGPVLALNPQQLLESGAALAAMNVATHPGTSVSGSVSHDERPASSTHSFSMDPLIPVSENGIFFKSHEMIRITHSIMTANLPDVSNTGPTVNIHHSIDESTQNAPVLDQENNALKKKKERKNREKKRKRGEKGRK